MTEQQAVKIAKDNILKLLNVIKVSITADIEELSGLKNKNISASDIITFISNLLDNKLHLLTSLLDDAILLHCNLVDYDCNKCKYHLKCNICNYFRDLLNNCAGNMHIIKDEDNQDE
jgi:hypothetical protein